MKSILKKLAMWFAVSVILVVTLWSGAIAIKSVINKTHNKESNLRVEKAKLINEITKQGY